MCRETRVSGDENELRAESYQNWLSKVGDDWRELAKVPQPFKDERMCMAALTSDGEAFQYFPRAYFNETFYPKAVATHGYALHHVPEASKTRELCMLAAKRRTSMAFIPEVFLDRLVVAEVVKNNPAQIKNVPVAVIDATLLAEYVATGQAYDLWESCNSANVPLEQVALIVVASGLDNLDKLPGYAMTEAVYRVAEQRFSWGAFNSQWRHTRTRHSPNYLESKTSREQLKRLADDPVAYRRYYARLFFAAWAVFWDDVFLKRMVEKLYGSIIASVPEALLSQSVCFAAVSKSGLFLRHVPASLRTLPVCVEAVRNNSETIQFVPAPLRAQVKSYLAY